MTRPRISLPDGDPGPGSIARQAVERYAAAAEAAGCELRLTHWLGNHVSEWTTPQGQASSDRWINPPSPIQMTSIVKTGI